VMVMCDYDGESACSFAFRSTYLCFFPVGAFSFSFSTDRDVFRRCMECDDLADVPESHSGAYNCRYVGFYLFCAMGCSSCLTD
jgi:hypothetical protein